jgi:integrase
MREHGYRDSTVRVTLRQVERLREAWGAARLHEEPVERLLGGARRYLSFVKAEKGKLSAQAEDFASALREHGATPLDREHRGVAKRVNHATSFTPDDWVTLGRALLEDNRPEAIVLHLQLATGYRVGDLLAIERKAFQKALRSGTLVLETKGGHDKQMLLAGAQAAWDRVKAYWRDGDTLAEWVCPRGSMGAAGGYGAYKRVDRHLKKLGRELKLEGRVHTHRFRRTVAVRALETTGDIHLVQQLLGHTSIQSTERYVDEPRLKAVAELQQKLAGGS